MLGRSWWTCVPDLYFFGPSPFLCSRCPWALMPPVTGFEGRGVLERLCPGVRLAWASMPCRTLVAAVEVPPLTARAAPPTVVRATARATWMESPKPGNFQIT